MKTCSALFKNVAGLLLLALAMLVFTGCKTTKPIDWNARVGVYTYDQAVTDMGPPTKETKLTDGNTVADWVTLRPNNTTVSVGTGFYGTYGGMGMNQTVPTGITDKVLRLTFAPDHKLLNWSKNY
jgi:hypothetical protein